MDSLINRYRNITVLVLVILAQLVLLAVQVKNDQDVRMIRVWAVTAVTPLARVIEGARSRLFGVLNEYVLLKTAQEENRRIRSDLDRLKMENLFLKSELAMADRAKALSAFQSRTPSRTLAARIIATGASAGSKLVFLDQGSLNGVQRGMGVVTPDGIVGKVLAAYPTAAEVLLVTDADFAAGVISQKNHVRGTLKGQGFANCKMDYVPNEEKIEAGEVLFTSGDDRIFPKGFPAAVVRVVRPGTQFKEIFVEPSGLRHGLEEVLILLEGVHQAIPEARAENTAAPVYLAPPPPAAEAAVQAAPAGGQGTEADRLLRRYKTIGDAQGHKFGEGLPGTKPPDFNLKIVDNPAEGARGRGGEGGTAGSGSQPAASPAAPAAPKTIPPSPTRPLSPSPETNTQAAPPATAAPKKIPPSPPRPVSPSPESASQPQARPQP